MSQDEKSRLYRIFHMDPALYNPIRTRDFHLIETEYDEPLRQIIEIEAQLVRDEEARRRLNYELDPHHPIPRVGDRHWDPNDKRRKRWCRQAKRAGDRLWRLILLQREGTGHEPWPTRDWGAQYGVGHQLGGGG